MTPLTTILILLVTATVSVIAFRRGDWCERLMFKPTEILRYKQYERMFTSGLIHADWGHLGWNAFSFFMFGRYIEAVYGPITLLAVYLAGIIGGSVLSLIVHRQEAEYRALGASGGVCGVIFASIFLLPGQGVMLFPLPVAIPAYLYAVIFLVTSFLAHRRRADNIGHDAHLGGAIVGLLTATALFPDKIFAAPWLFAGVLGLALAILILLIRDPGQLLEFRLSYGARPKGHQRYHRYDEARARREKLEEIDRLLDKVAARGIHSLSSAERRKLEQLSKEVGGRR
jgi:membrane associated rhomboid family serine protease